MSDWVADPMPLPCAFSATAAGDLIETTRGKAQAALRHGKGAVLLLFAVLLASAFAPLRSAWAQEEDSATLIVRVRSNQNGLTAVFPAAVNLSSETERPRSRGTATNGLATFTALPAGTYTVVVTAVGFKTAPRQDVTVTAGQTLNIDVLMQPVDPTELNVVTSVELLERANTSDYTRRHRSLAPITDPNSRSNTSWSAFPVGVGNQQSLNQILRSVPGFVPDALDQVHARGESPITNSFYLDGFLVPQFAALPVNRAFFLPDSIDALDVQTGGYAAEIGQASGSATHITTRQLPYYFKIDAAFKAGEYGTVEDYITFGGSLAGSRDSKAAKRAAKEGTLRRNGDHLVADGRTLPTYDAPASEVPRNLSYLITLSQRYTDYGSETPQTGGNTANNSLESDALFAKIDYTLNRQVEITGLLNYVSGRTQLPNRTGLDSSYAPYGQGFGYGGLQSRGLGYSGSSQADVDLGLRQKDNNNLNVLEVKRTNKNGSRLFAAFASTRSAQDTDLEGTLFPQTLKNLPADGPVEFLPTLNSKYDQVSIQADYTFAPSVGKKRGDIHNPKLGVVYHDITANEGYQLIPQSQAALNALAQIEPALLPNGSFVNGNYVIDPNNPRSPVLTTKREGYYAGAYLQDTWRIRAPLTLNYGLRADFYEMNISNLGTETTSYGGNKEDVSDSEISPRVNLALVLPRSRKLRFLSSQPTILRASYNRLFVTPSMGQGDVLPNQSARTSIPGVLGSQNNPINAHSVVPQKTDLYDASLERQFGSRAVAKVSIYHKDITNLVSSQQLIPLSQTGLLSTVNLGNATVDGGEISLEITPPREGTSGFNGYLTYSGSQASPTTENEVTSLGKSNSTPYLEWDQGSTLNLGLAYTTKNGAVAGVNFYYGDGLYSSALTSNGAIVRNDARQSVSQVNLRLASSPYVFRQRLGFQLQVENLFNSQKRLDWQSYVSGTRFQQERRVLGAITGRF